MKEELDAQLVKKYPKMFRNRYGDPKETLMCWGFECGDGWYTIIDTMCSEIDSYIGWKRRQRAHDLLRERAIKRGREAVTRFVCKDKLPSIWDEDRIDDLLNGEKLNVTPKVNNVIVQQVKEKFGGLRFYYEGGDDHVSGVVRMAERWAGHTCEVCSKLGETRHGGWIKTLCDEHEEERQQRYKERMKDVQE